MKISKQARREARQIYRSCLSDGALDESRARQAVQVVAQLKPRGYMGILAQLHKLVKLHIASRAAKIESAMPLAPDLQSQLQSDLKRLYGEGLSFSFLVKAELLGGIRIQVGGDVYDGSVLGRLITLRESF